MRLILEIGMVCVCVCVQTLYVRAVVETMLVKSIESRGTGADLPAQSNEDTGNQRMRSGTSNVYLHYATMEVCLS